MYDFADKTNNWLILRYEALNEAMQNTTEDLREANVIDAEMDAIDAEFKRRDS